MESAEEGPTVGEVTLLERADPALPLPVRGRRGSSAGCMAIRINEDILAEDTLQHPADRAT
eukprot:10664062-Prorocentrum_lima.AAC.1